MKKENLTAKTGKRRPESGERRTKISSTAPVSSFRFQVSGFRFPTSAFSLVEVTLALGLAGFCLVALLGLIPAGMRNASTATEQTAAVGLLGAVVADLSGTIGSSSSSPQYGIALPASGSATTSTNYFSDGGQTNARSQSRYVVESTITPQNNDLATARILIYWPAMATSTNAKGSVESVTVLDRK
ncbi:MAG: hypothetical protein ACOYM3_12445 [Terrimicrobiaceae bacterium]